MKRSGKWIEWDKILEVILVFLVLNTIMFYYIEKPAPYILWIGYYFTITLFALQALLSFSYSLGAIWHRKFEDLEASRDVVPPKTTFIISAYLPNELDVIEGTILNILKNVERPKDGIEIILAYNTPKMQGIEPRLKELALEWPELILANAYGSKSKSENLNYSIDMASGEMIVLIDADHRPSPDCLKKAWRWLEKKYDIVQGRCKIRNGGDSLITRLIEVEFEIIYGVNHFAKSAIFDSTLFGGSNGYWKRSVLKEIRFNKNMLTEDIDGTLRAILKGKKIFHDRTIVSTELAPSTLGGLWYQRKRWAQGWFQVSLKYQLPILFTEHLNVFQKFLWTTLLFWRVFYDLMTHFLFPIVFAFWLNQGYVSFPMSPYVWFCVIITLTSGPFETLTAYIDADKPKSPALRYIFYALMTFPYTLFKNTLQVVAMRDELLGQKEWVISERK